MKISLKLMLAACLTAALVACGSDDGPSETRVATSDTTANASAATTAAVTNTQFSFPGGVSELGTSRTTTVAFTSTGTLPSFTIDSAGEGTATGSTEFGSCIFRVSTSTFPSTHPLASGKLVTINPCTFKVNTANAPANGTPVTRTLTFQLGSKSSNGISVSVTISAEGVVTINSVTIGTTPVTTVTGGTS